MRTPATGGDTRLAAAAQVQWVFLQFLQADRFSGGVGKFAIAKKKDPTKERAANSENLNSVVLFLDVFRGIDLSLLSIWPHLFF